MKIRQSLRLYVLGIMLVTGVTLTFVLSGLSVNYFITGMDIGIKRSLAIEARYAELVDGKPYQRTFDVRNKRGTSTVVVSSTWADQPQMIQDMFQADDLKFRRLLKETVGESFLFLAPPRENYFATKIEVEGQVRYISMSIHAHEPFRVGRFNHIHTIFMIALVAIVVFTLVLWFVMRTVSAPVGRLKDWASDMDADDVKKPVPDFGYNELNALATIIQTSLRSVQESAEREKRFLGFASHELRTPIAVTRTNAELLRKLIEKNGATEKQLAVLDRIERAGVTMSGLTETLLWLNRQEEKSLPEQDLKLGDLVQHITGEFDYLLQGKAVTVDLHTDDSIHPLPEMLCRIVIANLVRNAFQHTQDGCVEIHQSGRQLVIINQDHDDTSASDDLGFGLGLELTNRLIQKYQWQYRSDDIPAGRRASVVFSQADVSKV